MMKWKILEFYELHRMVIKEVSINPKMRGDTTELFIQKLLEQNPTKFIYYDRREDV